MNINIIKMFTGTSHHDEEEIEQLYTEISQLLNNKMVTVMENWNAKVGSERVEDIIGNIGHGESKKSRKNFDQFCPENNLAYMNTFFRFPTHRSHPSIQNNQRKSRNRKNLQKHIPGRM